VPFFDPLDLPNPIDSISMATRFSITSNGMWHSVQTFRPLRRAHRPEKAATAARSRLAFEEHVLGDSISAKYHKGFTVTPRTFEVRTSGRWTVEILISRRARMRAFASTETCATELAATIACFQLGRRIIDRSPRDCGVDDLKGD
jgi:hypothetical protein